MGAKERAHRGSEIEPYFGVDLHLAQPALGYFDRIFCRPDFALPVLITLRAERRVVVFPEPVGPTHKIAEISQDVIANTDGKLDLLS